LKAAADHSTAPIKPQRSRSAEYIGGRQALAKSG
jgi:hypothetical protein